MKVATIRFTAFDIKLAVIFAIAVITAGLSAPDSPFRKTLCASSQVCVKSSHFEFWNTIAYNIGSGALLSIVIFYLLSRIPNLRAQAESRRSLQRSFRVFKLRCIDIFVVISGSPQSWSYEDLLDTEKFKIAFETEKKPKHIYWYDVANGLNKYYLETLSLHLEELREEIKRQTDRIDIYSEKDKIQLEAFARHLRLIQTSSDDYDSVKSLCGSLWTIFTSWDLVEGYSESDRLQKLIDSL